jgi:polysaccharide chain length determinant protein (PEP-CTERM system associated)
MEGALGGKREGSESAQRFLVDQIAEYERRLSAAEEKLATFKKTNVGLMPGAQGDYFSRLQTEMEAVTKAEALLRIAQSRRDEIQRQLRGEQPMVSTGAQGSGAPLSSVAGAGDDTATRIRATQARLDETLLRFTDKHPDVIALRSTLAELEARQKSEMDAVRRGDAGAAARSGLAANPVFQSIQLQLNQAEVEVAALRGEIGDRQRKIVELRKLVDIAPEVEAEYARLNRDYDVNRAQRQALVERLERTRFSEEADQTGTVHLDLIDPPSAGFKPVAPNRPLLIVAILFAGLGAGGGLAYLLYQLKPVFDTARQLGAITGLPVLGVVSMTWLEKQNLEKRRGILAFAGAAACLILAAGIVFLIHSRVTQFVHGLLT